MLRPFQPSIFGVSRRRTVVRTVRSLRARRSCAETQTIILCSAHDKIAHNRKWDGRGVVEGRGAVHCWTTAHIWENSARNRSPIISCARRSITIVHSPFRIKCRVQVSIDQSLSPDGDTIALYPSEHRFRYVRFNCKHFGDMQQDSRPSKKPRGSRSTLSTWRGGCEACVKLTSRKDRCAPRL